MDETTWLTSSEWLRLWHYAHDTDYLTDRKRRLLAVAACRRVIDLVTDSRLLQMTELAEEWADAVPTQLDERWWDRREDWCNTAFETITELHDTQSDAKCRAAASAFALLANDDHKIGRAVEWVAASDECPNVLGRGDRSCSPAVAHSIREMVGNPFRPVTFSPTWRTDTAVSLARGMYESRDFTAMPILADALQDAGCDNDDVLSHCRDANGVHVRGCWVVDLVLGKV